MVVNDFLSDLIARIKNGQRARLNKIHAPYSTLSWNFLHVLYEQGYLQSIKHEIDTNNICIELKYYENSPVIQTITRLSKPGKRVYISSKQLNRINNGLSLFILSTSKGILADRNAKKLALGGELLCKVF
uniref:Ribosomal protein S8 n=1 Tax=Seculamonas ecuadoriensis TaxID=221724 RepID=M4QMC9_SECEC|nr:ribosomal protein S8 [Seculamonas ecuadoriensis]AGH24513.1 ribosomal protein S8 [Seculamonas ecuadoriensis]